MHIPYIICKMRHHHSASARKIVKLVKIVAVLAADYSGLCTFCGAQVALSFSEHSQTNATSAATAQPSAQPVSANSLGEARPIEGPSSSAAQVSLWLHLS